MCFWIGIYPKPFFKYIEKPVEKIVQRVQPGFFDRSEAQLAKLPVRDGRVEKDIHQGQPRMAKND